MADLLQTYLGRFWLSSGQSIVLTKDGGSPVTVTLGEGWYYLHGTDTVDGFVEDFTRWVQIAGAPYTTASITIDQATGKCTFDTNCGGDCTIDWSDALEAQALLGFGVCTGVESYTATQQARYQWRPSEPFERCSAADPMRWWTTRGRSIVHVSGTGSSAVTERASAQATEMRYALLPKANVRADADDGLWDPFEIFFEDVIALGRPIRCYPDRTLATETTVFTARCKGGGEDGIGSFEDFCRAYAEDWDGLWSVTLQLIKYIAAS